MKANLVVIQLKISYMHSNAKISEANIMRELFYGASYLSAVAASACVKQQSETELCSSFILENIGILLPQRCRRGVCRKC